MASFSDSTITSAGWSNQSARRYDDAAASSISSTPFHDCGFHISRVPSVIHE
jgi:hypothetical protein